MIKTLVSSETQSTLLVVNIDGNWEAPEFATLFDSINKLYSFNLLIYEYLDFAAHERKRQNPEKARYLEGRGPHTGNSLKLDSFKIFKEFEALPEFNKYPTPMAYVVKPLKVRRVNFNSPGSVDFAGIGKIFEMVRDLLIHYIPNAEKKIDNQIKRKELELKDYELMAKRIELMQGLGVPPTDIAIVLGLESAQLSNVRSLMGAGKVTGIEIKPE